MNCLYCNKETKNPKYCSRSCSGKHTNGTRPRDTYRPLKPYYCKKCGDQIDRKNSKDRRRICAKCKITSSDIKLMTIGEYRKKNSVKGKHPSWIHSHVRQFNRSWNKHLTEKPCEVCGYDKHVELCHIIPVSSFPDDALLGEVNSEDNNRVLCRNHHWEFDNGLLKDN